MIRLRPIPYEQLSDNALIHELVELSRAAKYLQQECYRLAEARDQVNWPDCYWELFSVNQDFLLVNDLVQSRVIRSYNQS